MAGTDAFTNFALHGGTGGHIAPPYYADYMRENLWPNMFFRQFGTKVTIPQHHGDKVKIPRWDSPLAVSSYSWGKDGDVSAICGGITELAQDGDYPVGLKTLSSEDITGEVKEFLGGRSYTRKMVLMTKANFLDGALESLGRELAFDVDRYTRQQITASQFVKAAGATAGKAGTTDTLIGKYIARIPAWFDTYAVPRWDDNTFAMIAHPLAQYDVFSDTSANGFVSVARYNDASKIYRGEVGQMYGVRIVFSGALPVTIGATGANSADTGLSGSASGAGAYVVSPNAYYCIEVAGGGMQVIHKPLGSSGSVDWGNLKGSIGVTLFYGIASAPSTDYRLMRFGHGLSILN